MSRHTQEDVKQVIDQYIGELEGPLRELNLKIFNNPELAYEEHTAHDTICDFLEANGIPTTRHAYGLSTAFEAVIGEAGGRCINFNAEYDALPGIGHACGHNLIATASITGFVALAFAIRKLGLPGQVQLLGTPAEEDGGGKIDLLRAGAYKKAHVSLMMHPMAEDEAPKGFVGVAGRSSISCFDITVTYNGVSAHASGNPWEGKNALDAIVASYNNISMLRQQIRPDERIHGAILEAPKITNAIPEATRAKYTVRSSTFDGVKALGVRVRQCLEAGALATGCTMAIEENEAYANLVVNEPLCEAYQQAMQAYGMELLPFDNEMMAGSTDQGNVSHAIPALHAIIGIPVTDGAHNHTRQFTACAGAGEAHRRTILSGKAMAMTGWRLLVDNAFFDQVEAAFPDGRNH